MFVSQHGGRTEAGLVEGSVKCWNSALKRKHTELDEDADYHGNFDTEKFEHWFSILCRKLQNKAWPLQHSHGWSFLPQEPDKQKPNHELDTAHYAVLASVKRYRLLVLFYLFNPSNIFVKYRC
jgi:hypothetical protein